MILIGFQTGCSKSVGKADKPEIKQEDLVKLLADIHIAEAALESVQNRHERDSLATVYYSEAMRIHGVSQGQFDNAMSWWLNDANRSKELYLQVKERLLSLAPTK